MKFLTVVGLALFAVLSSKSFATAQFSDYVSIDGKSEAMHSNPLEPYFAKYPEKRPISSITSTALWRGYIAYFSITDARLRVEDIQINDKMEPKAGEPKMKSVVNEVFPPSVDRTVSWFTGFLILPQGKVVNYVHMGYASTFERYRLLFIKDGRLLADRVFSHDEYVDYKQQQFAAYTKSEAYKKLKQRTEARSSSVAADNFLYIFDVNFPMETLIDYKDFRPASAIKTEAAPKTK